MTAGMVVMILTAVAALFLAVRSLGSRRLGRRRTTFLAILWALIIGGAAIVLDRYGS